MGTTEQVKVSRKGKANRGAKPGERRGGRVAGTPNKATADVRATIALIAERNVEKVEDWLTRVAVDDPAKAADLFFKMIEYHIPKQARTEISGIGGKPIEINGKFTPEEAYKRLIDGV